MDNYHSRLVRQLVKGADSIDRMRREIKIIVGVVLSLLSDHNIQRGLCLPMNSGYAWTVDKDSKGRFFFCVYLPAGHVVYSGRDAEIPLYDVQAARNGLPALIEELTKMFPKLHYRFESLLDAADYKF